MSGRRIVGIVIALLVLGGLMWMKYSRRADMSGKVRGEMMVLLPRMTGYEANKALIDQVAGQAHDSAFSHAYTIGGRFTPTRFDDELYLREFFSVMRTELEGRGKHDLALAAQNLGLTVKAVAKSP